MDIIKIYVCYHKEFDVEQIDNLYQVQVGAAINTKLPNKIYDDVDENILNLK